MPLENTQDTCRHAASKVTKIKSKDVGRKPQHVGMGVAIKNFIPS